MPVDKKLIVYNSIARIRSMLDNVIVERIAIIILENRHSAKCLIIAAL